MDQYGFEDKFSDDEIKLFKEAFMFFDRNGDGTMRNDGEFFWSQMCRSWLGAQESGVYCDELGD